MRPTRNQQNQKEKPKDLFKNITMQLQSKVFEPGELKKSPNLPLPPKKTSRVAEMQCEQEVLQPHSQNYYDRTQQNSYRQAKQTSLMNSNVVDNYMFESKLQNTREELTYKIVDIERKLNSNLNSTFNSIVEQLNHMLAPLQKKNKTLQNCVLDSNDKLEALKKQFDSFSMEMEEKMERVLNVNNDATSSIMKSMSRNVGGEYAIELKSSMKDVIPAAGAAMVEEIKFEISETQEAIKSIRFDMLQLKEDLRNKTISSQTQNKQKVETVDSAKFNFIVSEFNNMKQELKGLDYNVDFGLKQFRKELQIQQLNVINMNETFKRVINTEIIPKMKGIEERIHVHSQTFQKQNEVLKKQVIRELQSMPILRVRAPSKQQQERLQRMKQAPVSQQDCYLLDQNNYVLDCFGQYLLDENNLRLRLEEEQVYYLQQVEGIEIKLAPIAGS